MQQEITGRALSMPAASTVEQSVKGIRSAFDPEKDMTTQDWKNLSRFADLATRTPIASSIVRPFAYLKDVDDKKIAGGGVAETARGMLSGSGIKLQKQKKRSRVSRSSRIAKDRKRGQKK